MTEVKTYWLCRTPSIKDIEDAYDLVIKNDIIVKLEWFVKYSGNYAVKICKADVDSMNAKDFYENRIPHVYGAQ